jgi:hypothetical protein
MKQFKQLLNMYTTIMFLCSMLIGTLTTMYLTSIDDQVLHPDGTAVSMIIVFCIAVQSLLYYMMRDEINIKCSTK